MMPADLLDVFRVSLGFLVIFGVVPWLVALNSPREDELMAHCAAFVRASLFTEVTTLVLGSMELCLPGSLAVAYILFLFTSMFPVVRYVSLSPIFEAILSSRARS